jgi:hypothetical protein
MRKLLAGLLFVPCIASAEFMSGNNLHGKMNGDFGDKMLALALFRGCLTCTLASRFAPLIASQSGRCRIWSGVT